MSKQAKLLTRLRSSPRDFTWDELVTLMTGLGYELRTGSGSSRKFLDRATGTVLMMHEPHPRSTLARYQVKDVLMFLRQEERL
jgi:hypothetical protein